MITVKFELSRQVFESDSSIKLHENPSSGFFHSDGLTDGRTDRYVKINSHF
jgi:hypothetical protein